jgi:3-keto-5-aminohexanoate cleavage enzyme
VPMERIPVLFVLGRYSLLRTGVPLDLLPYLAPDLPRFAPWSVCAFGKREAACVIAGALLGGHVRVGFENNLVLPSGLRAASNADLVETSASALESLGLMVQTADGLREEISAALG